MTTFPKELIAILGTPHPSPIRYPPVSSNMALEGFVSGKTRTKYDGFASHGAETNSDSCAKGLIWMKGTKPESRFFFADLAASGSGRLPGAIMGYLGIGKIQRLGNQWNSMNMASEIESSPQSPNLRMPRNDTWPFPVDAASKYVGFRISDRRVPRRSYRIRIK